MTQKIGWFLHQLTKQLLIKTYYRKYENTYKRKTNKMCSLILNKNCISIIHGVKIYYFI